MMRAFDIFRLLSFYCSMAGFYVVTLQAMWSVYLFTITNLMFSMMGMEVYDIFQYAVSESVVNASSTNSSDGCSHRRALNEAFRLAPEVFGGDHGSHSSGSACQEESGNIFDIDWSSFFTNLFSFNIGGSDESVSSVGAAAGLQGDSAADKIITQQYAAEVYSSAFILHLGMLMMIPLFLEHTVQRSLFFAMSESLRMLASLSFIFYPFSMQTRGHNFGFAINYGRAGYVATGRGYAIDTSSMVTMYSNYAASHIYFGFEIGAMLLLYEQWKTGAKGLLSTWGMWTVAFSLTLAPWLFNPHSLQVSSLAPSWVEWTHWLYGRGNLKVGNSCWVNWAQERLRLKRAAPRWKKLQLLARNGLSKMLLFVACVDGLDVTCEVLPGSAIYGQCSTAYRAVLTLMATAVFVVASVLLAAGIGVFEFFMKEANRTKALPVYTIIICTLGYVAVASLLMRFERGSWHAPTALVGQRNVWYLMLAASAMQAWLVQVLGALPDGLRGRSRCRHKWMLVYAGFWQRMVDQAIALVIFAALFVLSVLPVSSLQTRILFNQAFSEVIQKKIHRQNLLSDLYTPGLFQKAEADDTADEGKGRKTSIFAGRRSLLPWAAPNDHTELLQKKRVIAQKDASGQEQRVHV